MLMVYPELNLRILSIWLLFNQSENLKVLKRTILVYKEKI